MIVMVGQKDLKGPHYNYWLKIKNIFEGEPELKPPSCMQLHQESRI